MDDLLGSLAFGLNGRLMISYASALFDPFKHLCSHLLLDVLLK